MSKSPSSRRRPRGRYRYSDDCRRPFPNVEPATLHCATYEITPLGRVYRDDGLLLRPRVHNLHIQLNSGHKACSLPKAVYEVFGRKSKKMPRTYGPVDWVPWVHPDGEIDEATGRRSCSVKHVVLANRFDLIRIARGTMPLEQLKTVKIR
jgi:hypothetical protein